MKRREFIILTGVGATSAGMLSACGHPEEKLIPALIPDDEYVPGIDVWKASTCAMCDAGCGIVVRTRDHKANKIEGNPQHPVNRGALCARGQAGLQVLYNPDRIKAPMKRVGERFSGQFAEISWDEAIKILADKLRDLSAIGKANSVHFFTNDRRGMTAHIATRFMEAFGSHAYLVNRLFNEDSAISGFLNSYPFVNKPVFDIANATFLLSFGARFLETWHSPILYSRAYGDFRRASGKVRGKFVQVEPRMSLTGANADEWLPARVGSEALVACAIAQVILREGLAKNTPDANFIKSFEAYSPENTAALTDIAAEKIIRIAREFAKSDRPLAITSSTIEMTKSLASLKWANFLNLLVGNINQKGGMLLLEKDYTFPLAKLDLPNGFSNIDYFKFPMMIADRPCEILMIHNFNPAYVVPATKKKLKTIPFIASFSSFMDETSELADLLLPDHTSLESWDINYAEATSEFIVNLTQPVVKPEFNTKQTADVFIALSRALGDKVAASISFSSIEETVKQGFTSFAKKETPALVKKKAAETDAEEDSWKPLSEKGFFINKLKNNPAYELESHQLLTNIPLTDSLLSDAYEDQEYPFALLVYEHPTLGVGEQANLPLLQELPDAMTSVMWGSWLEINPKTAAQLGIKDGDVVEIAVEEVAIGGDLRTIAQFEPIQLPAVLYAAIRPDVLAMPCGQGHTAYGRYATNKGVNAVVFTIGSAGNKRGILRAKVKRISNENKLIRFGTNLPEHIEIKR
ncbi:MAG: molybdopterin-dependent oxidoreductase [Acidobacteria bacterium]|nr:molybdopterin-dependent oxidoreductase [Acidobacteriota bacterium]